jgi:hypothetical protein
MNRVEQAPADEKDKERKAREQALAEREREKVTLLAERGIDFTVPFPEFFAALPADVRTERRIAHTKAVDGYLSRVVRADLSVDVLTARHDVATMPFSVLSWTSK